LIRNGQTKRVGLKQIRFCTPLFHLAPCGHQHGMAKIAPVHRGGLTLRLERQHEIAGAAANVENSRAGLR